MLLFYYIVVFPMTMNEGSIIFYVLVSLVLVLVFTLFLLCHTTHNRAACVIRKKIIRQKTQKQTQPAVSKTE